MPAVIVFRIPPYIYDRFRGGMLHAVDASSGQFIVDL
jgi:hypothetical protein